MVFLKFTCNVETLERKSESMDLPMRSDKLRNMYCPSSLTVYYFYDSGRKTISFSIQESEIFPKTFLGLICSHPLSGGMFLNATWSEAEELLATGWSSFWKFMERLYKFMEKKSMQNYQTPVKNLCLWTSEARAADEKSISEVS